MEQQNQFQFNTIEQDALCELDGDMLIIQPLASTRYAFCPGDITGDMLTPGIGIADYCVETQRWSGGGVLTRQQVVALRDFLDRFIQNHESGVIEGI